MNLVQLANDLEYVPRKELAEMSQDPNSFYPAYLVLSEIQRRTLNDKNFAAMQERPTTTVAEEVVDEFMQPQLAENQSQGLQVGAPQSATPLPDSNISAGLSGVPTAPMQMAASGGATGYANKGKTEYKEYADDYGKQLQEIFEKEGRYKKRYSDYEKGERFTYPLTPRDYVVSDEEYSRLKEGDYVMGEGALQEYRPFLMLLNALDGESGARYMPESEVKGLKAKLKASIMEDKLSQMGMAEGGITGYAEGNQTALDASFQNPYADQRSLAEQGFPNEIDPDQKNMIVERYTDPDGTFAYKRALADGFNAATLAMILAPEPTSSAVGLAARGIAGTGKALYGAIRNPKQTLDKGLEALGKLKSRRQQGNRFNNPVSSPQSTSNLPTPPGYFKDIGAETVKGLVNPALRTAGAVYLGSQLLPDGEEKVVKQELTEEQLKIQELERQLAERENLKGLAGATAEKDNTGNWRDLARLGAGIMSAKNVSDIGGTVTNILDAQDKRGLVGLQSKFTQAQTDQILATTKAMPLEKKLATLQSLGKLFEKISSGEIEVTEEQKASYALQYQILNDEVLKMQGIASSGSKFLTEAEQKIFNQAKAG
jgi:hypothetical protein